MSKTRAICAFENFTLALNLSGYHGEDGHAEMTFSSVDFDENDDEDYVIELRASEVRNLRDLLNKYFPDDLRKLVLKLIEYESLGPLGAAAKYGPDFDLSEAHRETLLALQEAMK